MIEMKNGRKENNPGMTEPKYTVKDGIAFYEEPYIIDYSQFVSEHLDCDSIIKDDQDYNDIVQVIAFATKEEFNDALKDVLDTKFNNGYKRLRHLSSVGLNSMW